MTIAPFTLQKKKWVRTRKKVGTDQIFFPCKPSVLCFHEMGPDSLFWFLWPKTEKKKKKKKNESGSLLLFESGVSTLLRSVPSSLREPAVVYGGFAHVYYSLFSHKPNLIVTPVNG